MPGRTSSIRQCRNTETLSYNRALSRAARAVIPSEAQRSRATLVALWYSRAPGSLGFARDDGLTIVNRIFLEPPRVRPYWERYAIALTVPLSGQTQTRQTPELPQLDRTAKR